SRPAECLPPVSVSLPHSALNLPRRLTGLRGLCFLTERQFRDDEDDDDDDDDGLPSASAGSGEPRAPDRVLAMIRQSEPTSSTLQLVANDMTGIMEKLDTRELDLEDGEYDTTDTCDTAERLPFTVIYHTLGFKEPEAKVFLSSPITAKILEVERFTKNQDRFNVTSQRSVNKSLPAVFKIELKHGEFTWLVKRKEKHFMDLHRELRTYKTFMRLPLPSRSHTVKRQTATRSEMIPNLPRGGREELGREEQVSSRRKQLEDYLNNLLKMPMYRNYHATMEFIDVSQLSFIHDLGPKGL
ncbi:hypothetical protein FQN60_013461, partial [Etheostoma spectabile]